MVGCGPVTFSYAWVKYQPKHTFRKLGMVQSSMVCHSSKNPVLSEQTQLPGNSHTHPPPIPLSPRSPSWGEILGPQENGKEQAVCSCAEQKQVSLRSIYSKVLPNYQCRSSPNSLPRVLGTQRKRKQGQCTLSKATLPSNV